MPSVTLHPPGMAVPGVAGCGGSEGLVGLEMGSGWCWGGGGQNCHDFYKQQTCWQINLSFIPSEFGFLTV